MTIVQPSFGLPLENILFGFLLFYEQKMIDYLFSLYNGLFIDYIDLKRVSVPCKEEQASFNTSNLDLF